MDPGLAIVLGTLGLIALFLGRDFLLPPMRRAALVASVAARIGSTSQKREDDYVTVDGTFDGWPVSVVVGPGPQAVVRARLSAQALSPDLRIFETSGWSYQRAENRSTGLTVNTGDPEFDEWYDAYGDDPKAALRVPPAVRKVLVERRRPGVTVAGGYVTVAKGAATPYGYLGGSDQTLAGVEELLRDAVGIARALELPGPG